MTNGIVPPPSMGFNPVPSPIQQPQNIQQQQGFQNQFPQSTQQHNKIVPAFLSRFINHDFIEKIIKVTLYQADFSTVSTRSTDITKFLQRFLKETQHEIRKSPNSYFKVPKNLLISASQIAQQVIELREDVSARLVTYDNIMQHFPKRDLNTEKLLRNVSTNRIQDIDTFRQTFDIIIQTIQSYNEISQIKKTLTLWDGFLEESEKDDSSVLNIIRSYRDLIATSYNDLSNLTTITKNEELEDYMVLSDNMSVKKVVNNLLTFLGSGYSFFKTGYSIFDQNIGGLESSTFHLITGPSNHAKSIFMINLCKNVIINNPNEFRENDAVLFITLEDDTHKLLRRFLSIFGNVSGDSIKRLFVKCSSLLKSDLSGNNKNALNAEVSRVLTKLISEAIIKITGKSCPVIVKHCNENVFSPGDVTKFIDLLRLQGHNVKAAFVDYIDVMVPTNSRYSSYNDYDAQGAIIQELRLASRVYSIPMISITQNNKTSENATIDMSNALIGDSYKKVRYSDYIYMIRMRNELDILSPQVKNDVCQEQTEDVSFMDMSGNNYTKTIVPFEVKITKAKEGTKNVVRFHLFAGMNLKIYETLSEFFLDLNPFKHASSELENQIDIMGMNMKQQIGQDQSQLELDLI